MCAIFLFNLLVGVGILALPAAVAHAGIISGTLCLIVVSFMAFMSLTFVIEVLASANAWKTTRSGTSRPKGADGHQLQVKLKTDIIQGPLFEIEERIEMGSMAELFLGSSGATLFYTVLCLYLYGVSNSYMCPLLTSLKHYNFSKILGASLGLSDMSRLCGLNSPELVSWKEAISFCN